MARPKKDYRNEIIVEMNKNCVSREDISKYFDISLARVSSIIKKYGNRSSRIKLKKKKQA